MDVYVVSYFVVNGEGERERVNHYFDIEEDALKVYKGVKEDTTREITHLSFSMGFIPCMTGHAENAIYDLED